MRAILRWFRDVSSKFLYRFGIHCATHQIRLILVSGLVITSLFYPALAIYFSNNAHLSASIRSHILDYVYSPESPSQPYYESDLISSWTRLDGLRVNDDPVNRARCGTERTIRVERVFFTGKPFDDSNIINRQALAMLSTIEDDLSNELSSRGALCFLANCASISPLLFWDHDLHSIISDPNLLGTFNSRKNIKAGNIPIDAAAVIAGREMSEDDNSFVEYASFLAVTYLFHEDDCGGSGSHDIWIKALERSVPSYNNAVKKEEPVLLALEFNPDMKRHGISALKLLLYLSYIIFFVYLSGSMRRMNTVHSRIGLCFTGLVEIIVSTIASLSVCALGGLRITMVPWSIFPVVIIFVGAENMFRLVDDVVKTPISLPVKERIGIGLSRAGTSNTLKVVSYNTIIGVIGFFSQGAIRQFCIFATVVLVAHWFLIHTFFVAVLSIDIQRLELNDLIRQGGNVPPSLNKRASSSDNPPKSPLPANLIGSIRKVTKGRLSKNFSLLLLLAFTGALYYSTLPPTAKPTMDMPPLSRPSAVHSKASDLHATKHHDALHLWRVLNPEDDRLLHLRIESPSIVTLRVPENGTTSRPSARSKWSNRTLRSLWWISKIMVLPIGTTLSALYVLLLYLLKGTDQLESDGIARESDEIPLAPLAKGVSLKTFPRVFASDVLLLGCDTQGSLVISVSQESEVQAWFVRPAKCVIVDTADFERRAAAQGRNTFTFTSIAVTSAGDMFAISSSTGVIALWTVEGTDVTPLRHLFSDNLHSPVKSMEFVIEKQGTTESQKLVACYENSTSMLWTCSLGTGTQIECSLDSLRNADLLRAEAGPSVCFTSHDGEAEVVAGSHNKSHRIHLFKPPFISSIECVTVDGIPHVLLAAASRSGVITIHDLTTDERVMESDEAVGSITQLRVLQLPIKPCTQCGEQPLSCFLLVYQVGSCVFMDKGCLSKKCACPIVPPFISSKCGVSRDSPLGKRSRSGSFVSSGNDGPRGPRSRVTSFSGESAGTSSFPVSGHGLHSRRASDKDHHRRSSDKLASLLMTSDSAEKESGNRLTVPNGREGSSRSSSHTNVSPSERWRGLRMSRVQEANCARGGWDVVGNKIIGIRRMPRIERGEGQRNKSTVVRPALSLALSSSILDRWQLWTFCPAKHDWAMQASLLSRIHTSFALNSDGYLDRQMQQLSFTRLSPFTVIGTRCLVGFGNTIGLIEFPTVDTSKSK
ncbi:hypothetical protein SCHPADRAFT_844758 [Schizopora paradoxa]|uniref:Sterol regulatory element-binding protein cleavage-activating protein n=1 Tax=Schizopora paradoxa TaxID=27342 RepID=A0A0H2S3H7_9AGAM|nr:hypothetical protein SCHPADRAFT_844758 [Schizopora paradoxa]